MYLLPSHLREFQVELAGRLVLSEEAGRDAKELREKYGFTQDWLAGLLGMRRESLSRIESGHVSLSVSFVQRFTKIMTLARGVREHIAYVEARDSPVDEAHLAMLAVAMRLDRETTDEVILASQISYEQKRKSTLRGLAK